MQAQVLISGILPRKTSKINTGLVTSKLFNLLFNALPLVLQLFRHHLLPSSLLHKALHYIPGPPHLLPRETRSILLGSPKPQYLQHYLLRHILLHTNTWLSATAKELDQKHTWEMFGNL